MFLEHGVRPLAQRLSCARHDRTALQIRTISATPRRSQETNIKTGSDDPLPPDGQTHRFNPNTVHTPRSERKLFEIQKQSPIGSRRRRAALATTTAIPFEELPFQCFQEARKILLQDRAETVEAIRVQRERLDRLRATAVPPQDEAHKAHRIRSMGHRLEQLKIYADNNDPLVKKRFEDGLGDMNKPIYRHLAEQKWRSYKRKVLVQRIEQMNVVPDVLAHVDPTVNTSLAFGSRSVQHGDFVDSRVSEIPPRLTIQPYDRGARLVTIAVVTPDIPDVAKDGFTYRCHFLASNISISPTETAVELGALDSDQQVILPWHPPYSQKGAPYQRLAVFVLEQPASDHPSAQRLPFKATEDSLSTPARPETRSLTLPIPHIKSRARYTVREHFNLRSFADKFSLRPVGVDLFRTVWDEGTAGVMQRLGVAGWDVEFKRKRVDPLPYQRLKGERFR